MNEVKRTANVGRIVAWVLGGLGILLAMLLASGIIWEKTGAYVADWRLDISTSDANGSALISKKFSTGTASISAGNYIFFIDETGMEKYGRITNTSADTEGEGAVLSVALPGGEEVITQPVMITARTEYSIAYLGMILHFVGTPLGIICCVAIPLFIFLVIEIVHLVKLPNQSQGEADEDENEDANTNASATFGAGVAPIQAGADQQTFSNSPIGFANTEKNNTEKPDQAANAKEKLPESKKEKEKEKEKEKKAAKEPAYMLMGMNSHKPEPMQAAISPLAITPANPVPAKVQMPELQNFNPEPTVSNAAMAQNNPQPASTISEAVNQQQPTQQATQPVAQAQGTHFAPEAQSQIKPDTEYNQPVQSEQAPQAQKHVAENVRYDDVLSRWRAEFPAVANYQPTSKSEDMYNTVQIAEVDAEIMPEGHSSKAEPKSSTWTQADGNSGILTGKASAMVEPIHGEDAILRSESYENEIRENVEPLTYVKNQPEQPAPDSLDITREYYISTDELANSQRFAAELYSNSVNKFTIEGISVDVNEECLRLALDEALKDREISITVTKDYTNVVVGDSQRGDEISFALLNQQEDETAKVIIRKSHNVNTPLKLQQ